MSVKYNNKNRTKLPPYSVSSQDIFHVSKERVNAQHNGATVIIPHVCNNVDAFGAGFASCVAQEFPSVKADYHLLGKSFLKNNLGYTQFIKVYEEPKYRHRLVFANMIAQNGIISSTNDRPLNYLALAKCMVSVSKYINDNTDFLQNKHSVEIHAPKFGSGLSGGNWAFISDIIEDIWSSYNICIHIPKNIK
jgi:hypothetical protein